MEIVNILLAVLTILVGYFGYSIYQNLQYWKQRKIPYIKAVPFFGNFTATVLRKRNLCDQIRHLYNQCRGRYCGIHIFNTPYLLLKDPELIKHVLVKDFKAFMDRGFYSDEKRDPVVFYSLFFSKGTQWKSMRSKVSPIFTSGKMKLMTPLIEQCCANLENLLETETGNTVEILGVIERLLVDVICSCAFGLDVNSLKRPESYVVRMAEQLVDASSIFRTFSVLCSMFIPALVKVFNLTFADQDSSNYFIDMYKNTREARIKENVVRNDLIDMQNNLLQTEKAEDGFKFDVEKMAIHAVSFFSAGLNATSTALAFIIHDITVQKGVQDKIREEINIVYEKHGSLTYDAVQDLKYMDLVIKESLRMYPLTSLLVRECNETYTFPGTDLTIEKGTLVMVPVSGLHFDEKHFPNPFEFAPERFAEENKDDISPYTYIPFGLGPRMCIGERFGLLILKAALFSMLRKYQFVPCEKTENPIRMNQGAAFLVPNNGVNIKVLKAN